MGLVMKEFGGKVPDSMKQLITLPGVGRKTANVVLTHHFKKNEGICVDTHVGRVAKRLGLSKGKDAVAIEKDLMELTRSQEWDVVTHLLISHGRSICDSRKPQCELCGVREKCDYFSIG